MGVPLTAEDCDIILESLNYTLTSIRDTGIDPHGTYPSYESKQSRLAQVERVMQRVRQLKKQMEKENEHTSE